MDDILADIFNKFGSFRATPVLLTTLEEIKCFLFCSVVGQGGRQNWVDASPQSSAPHNELGRNTNVVSNSGPFLSQEGSKKDNHLFCQNSGSALQIVIWDLGYI